MSFINFEKGSGKHRSKEEIEEYMKKKSENREIQDKERKKTEFRSQLKIENQWMLPSLEKQLQSRTGKKEKKKKKDKKRAKKEKHKKNKKHKSSSSSEDSESEEWEEKKTEESKCNDKEVLQRDNWMEMSMLSSSRETKKDRSKPDVNRCIIEKQGQSSRELNPYWRDGGSGVPKEGKELSLVKNSVGDQGVDWLRRALKRAKETAKDEGRSLDEVVSERWGSLKKLESLIDEAESRQRGKRGSYRKPADDSEEDRRTKKSFWKPSDREEVQSDRRYREPGKQRNWMKKEFRPDQERIEKKPEKPRREEKRGSPSSSSEDAVEETNIDNKGSSRVLTDEELNALAAKVVKAEIMGDERRIQELKKELEEARKGREKAAEAAGGSQKGRVEEIILMKTNAKGLTRPAESSGLREPTGGRRKKQKMETHSGGERVRYFPDDDKYTLRDMFEREKLNTVDDEKELFVKMMGKGKVRTESDEEDSFVENARVKRSDGKETERERNRVIQESKRRVKSLDGCAWCLDSKHRAKHLVVSIGETCYLCLPAEESLTEGHCLVVPVAHTPCGTALDEDVWSEMTTFRRRLTDMFLARDMDVVFFENARGFHRFPHMVLHCVPVDRESGGMAPIYFKKAIQECETEWSTNKKLIDLSQKDVRRAVPKGLTYFSVDFGTQGGFAHVIEDEQLFPANFAQEVIGGMLDLDHRKWRKHKNESFNAQRDKVLEFAKHWKKYDFTSSKKRRSSSPSSSSSSSSSD